MCVHARLSLTSEPLVGRADHGIALFPVKLNHPVRGNTNNGCLVFLLSWRVNTWVCDVPVDVLEEALLAPAVQQLGHHELKGGRT